MSKEFKIRYRVVMIIVGMLFMVLLIQLLNLQWRDGEQYAAEAVAGLDKELRLTGSRGMIVDSNGVPLAYDQNSYNVVFYKDPSRSTKNYGAEYTDIIRKTIDIVEGNNGECITSFNIKVEVVEGVAEYSFYFAGIQPEDVQARINKWIDNMSIYDSIQEDFNKWWESVEKEVPLELEEGQEQVDIEYLYWYVRDRYSIPQDVSFEEAEKLLSVWQEVQKSSYRSYAPVTVAEDVNFETVATIEMLKIQLDGMDIEEESIRIYPKNELAAHIVGYMGRMLNEATLLEYEASGYSRDDLIGISGIEAEMEFELSANIEGKTGTRVVEVDSRGKVVGEISVDPPTDGNTVMLTIDATMQKKLEEALEENIRQINAIQVAEYNDEHEEKYDQYVESIEDIDLAEIGAAVVMQVQTGEILAMSSYPSYDPNWFTGGLSYDHAEELYQDPRHPLFNNAIASTSTPGSIFKMVTAVGGLMEGVITLETEIDDEGEWDSGIASGKKPSCWVYPKTYLHQNQTVVDGLRNSCNYFFFTVADYLGNINLNKWASLLGLDSKTNVELTGEIAGQIASQDTLYTSGETPTGKTASVFAAIKATLKRACVDAGYEYEEELFDEVTLTLMDLVVSNTNEWGPDVRGILKNELELDTNDIENGIYQSYDDQIVSFLLEIRWTDTENILTGIGQSVTLLTPIGVARYVSAIVNGGYVYDASLIKAVISPDGKTTEEFRPKLIRELNINQEYVDAIKEGMSEVVSLEDGGTAGRYFTNFKYLDEVGGKTGTAEIGDIDLENNAWFVAFAPFDQPEIAVVVMIPNGYSGGLASYTAREIIEYYLDEKYVEEDAPVLPDSYAITP